MKFTNVPTNYGLIIEPPKPEDYVFGAERSLGSKFAGREVLQPDGDWTNWLPEGEPQNISYETQACVTYSALNILETLRKRQFDVGENLSDRFVAKGSDTNPNGGNTMQRVAEFVRQNWSVFESEYPVPPTLAEFYQEIPRKYYPLAQSRGTAYQYGYELVDLPNLKEALKYSPVQISVPAWSAKVDGQGNIIYYRPQGKTDNHAVMLFKIKDNGNLMIFDSYPPYIKELEADIHPNVRMGYHLAKANVNEPYWSAWIRRVYEWFKSKL